LLTAPPTRRLLASADSRYKYAEIDGFLRISSGAQRARPPEETYRSIITSRDDSASESDDGAFSIDVPSESEWDSDEDNEGSGSRLTAHQQTLKDLEQRLSADPRSISTWVSLLTQTVSSVPAASKNAQQTRADLAIAVLTRARAAHPENARAAPLLLRLMRAGEEVWQPEKLRSEWENALKTGDVELIMEWLDWKVRKAEDGMDGIVAAGVRAMRLVEHNDLDRLRVFWRIAVAFQQAGWFNTGYSCFLIELTHSFRLPRTG
jgi:hypothetical protein